MATAKIDLNTTHEETRNIFELAMYPHNTRKYTQITHQLDTKEEIEKQFRSFIYYNTYKSSQNCNFKVNKVELCITYVEKRKETYALSKLGEFAIEQ